MRPIPQDGPARLMFFVQRRLVQLGWSRDDLFAHGGPSPSTLYKAYRLNREMDERTMHKLERAVGWEEESCRITLDGGEPTIRLSDQVETVKTRVDAAVAESERVAVGRTAAELRDFLMGVAEQLREFYPDDQAPHREPADAGAH
ncbi:XRE family transcriptional regulator [Mycolicibacterium sp.]|uniref:XRE family transcriptional regulator n=1 Tax=Mycolicibacterium sp. TaxID=2320850 RepID=UPI0037C50B71